MTCTHTCNQGRSCTCAATPATVAPSKPPVRKYTCAQLGVCQGHQPPCIGCYDELDAAAVLDTSKPEKSSIAETLSYRIPQIVTGAWTVVMVAGSAAYVITKVFGG